MEDSKATEKIKNTMDCYRVLKPIFELIDTDVKGNVGLMAFKCADCKKIFNVSTSSMLNLKRHLKNNHKHLISKYDYLVKMAKMNSKNVPRKVVTKPECVIDYSDIDLSQEDLDELILDYLTDQMLPFCTCEKHTFRRLVEAGRGNLRVKTRKTYAKMFDVKFKKLKTKMKKILKKVEEIAITADLWTKTRRSYLGITAHYLNENLERKKLGLGCKRLTGSHTFDNIGKEIQNVIKEFGIERKLVGSTSDQGSNILKSFKEWYWQDDSVENSESTHECKKCKEIIARIKAAKSHPEGNTDLDEILSNIVHFPPNFRCCAHRLHLICTKDTDFKKVEDEQFSIIGGSAFLKIKQVINLQQRSTRMSDLVDSLLGKKFSVPCVTRWNSWYKCVEVVNKFINEKRENLNELMENEEFEPFTDDEIIILKEYEQLYKPIAEVLDIMQGEEKAYLGMVLPLIRITIKKIEAIEENLIYSKCLAKLLKESIHKRFNMDFKNKHYIISAVSFPTFKADWTESEKEREEVLKMLKEEIIEIQNENKSEETENNKDKHLSEGLMNFIGNFKERKNQTGNDHDLQYYLSDKIVKIEDLKKIPTFEKIFRKYNTILPSSGSVERLFSYGGLIFGDRRHNLKDSRFEASLLLKVNENIMK